MNLPLFACAACYGQSDSPMAAGMNWGILSLLITVVLVLGAIVAFFIHLARRSAAASANEEPLLPELRDLEARSPTGKSSAHLIVFCDSLRSPATPH